MFSPSANDGGPATATRSRRRQRPLSSESVAQPKAKRQRLPLTEQTFVNPEVQPTPAPRHQQPSSNQAQRNQESIEVKPEKISPQDSRKENDENFNTPRRDLNVRAKKTKHGDRAANKGDGSLVLVRVNSPDVSGSPCFGSELMICV